MHVGYAKHHHVGDVERVVKQVDGEWEPQALRVGELKVQIRFGRSSKFKARLSMANRIEGACTETDLRELAEKVEGRCGVGSEVGGTYNVDKGHH